MKDQAHIGYEPNKNFIKYIKCPIQPEIIWHKLNSNRVLNLIFTHKFSLNYSKPPMLFRMFFHDPYKNVVIANTYKNVAINY